MSSINKNSWNHFISAAKGGSFLQSWEWGKFQQENSVEHWRLLTSSAAALVIKRSYGKRCWLYLPHGPVFSANHPVEDDWSAIIEQLLDLAHRQSAIFIRVEPSLIDHLSDYLEGHHWRKADHDVQPRHTTILNINKPADQLLYNFHSKTRYNIRLAQKKGVNIRFSTDSEDLRSFLKLTYAVSQRSPFQYHLDQYYYNMLKALAPSNLLQLAIAEHQQQVLAVHLLITFAGTTTYVHGASDSTSRHLMGPHLLHWESILKAKQQGATKYDFFGVAPPTAPTDHPWAGITRFKLGFNGVSVSYIGAYDLILDRGRYFTINYLRKFKSFFR